MVGFRGFKTVTTVLGTFVYLVLKSLIINKDITIYLVYASFIIDELSRSRNLFIFLLPSATWKKITQYLRYFNVEKRWCYIYVYRKATVPFTENDSNINWKAVVLYTEKRWYFFLSKTVVLFIEMRSMVLITEKHY